MPETLQTALIGANIILTLSILLYASWSDYKTREVSNRVWVVYAPIALALSLSEILIFVPAQLPIYGISVGAMTGLALVLFYVGGFGGADAKALMCLALSLPFAPQALFSPAWAENMSPISQFIFPLTVFTNAVLFAALSGVYMVIRNIVWHKKYSAKMFADALARESIGKKLAVLITGYKVNISKLREKWHVFPMEDALEDSPETIRRNLVVIPREENREGIVDRLSKAVESGKIGPYIWATPGLPLLIFVTLGLIVALVFGDVVWIFIRFILG